MSNTQSIIVYTNPYQRDFYESGMLIPLIGGLAVGFILFTALCASFERHVNSRKRGSTALMTVFALVSLLAGGFTFHWLFV